jgi:protein-S-isoprenylcysteine O-methyltransferase Ste14
MTVQDALRRFLAFARSTPHRTFVVYPLTVLVLKVLASRGNPRFRWRFAPLLAWGYLQYRLCGEYRRARAGGGWGMQTLPDQMVTTGPYAYTRNPMYLGHLIFLFGLGLFVRSKLVLIFAAGIAYWFNQRVAEDERRLETLWGTPYRAYRASVPRWLPKPVNI